MKHSTLKKLEAFFESPKLKLALGLLLLISASLEAVETILADVVGFEFGVHHGMIIFAFAKIGEAISKIGIELVEIEAGADEVGKNLNSEEQTG